MSRFVVAAIVSLMLCPTALACGMYMPDDTVLLTDLLNEIDGVEDVVEAPVLEEHTSIAEVLEANDAVAEVTPEPASEAHVTEAPERVRRHKRARRRAKR